MQKLSMRKSGRRVFARIRIASMAAIVAVGSYAALLPKPAWAADCNNPPTNTGTAIISVAVPTNGTYRIWSKLTSSNASSDSVLVNIDNQECHKLGDTPLAANAWTWVGHQDGNTALKATTALTAGQHTIKLTGVEAGVKLGRVLLLGDTNCIPTGNGDNCTTVSGPDTQAPTVPGALKATVTSKRLISLSWTASQDNYAGVSYDIYRSTGGSSPVKVGTATETGYYDSNLAASTTYNYYVIARDTAGNQSQQTAIVSGKTLAKDLTGFGKMYGQVKFSPQDASKATISFMVNGTVKSYDTDANGYYYITDIPVATYLMKFQAGNSYKFIEVKTKVGDTVKDLTLPKAPAPQAPAPASAPFVTPSLDTATLAKGATFVTESDNSKSILLTADVTNPDPDPNPGTGELNCIANPSRCGYPDATNTGWRPTGTTLTTNGVSFDENGDFLITEPGAVIDSKRIDACVVVMAPNVTIKRSLITNCQGQWNVRLYPGASNFTIEDTEIDGNDFGGQRMALTDDGQGPVTIRRVYMHNLTEGPHGGEKWLMEDSYFTDVFVCEVCHNDGFQSAGAIDVTLKHNTIVVDPPDYPDPNADAGKNAVIRIATEQGPVRGFIVENNLLSGGNYAVQVRSQGSGYPEGVKLLNNRIVPNWRFGPYDPGPMSDYPMGAIQIAGNYRDDTGALLLPEFQ